MVFSLVCIYCDIYSFAVIDFVGKPCAKIWVLIFHNMVLHITPRYFANQFALHDLPLQIYPLFLLVTEVYSDPVDHLTNLFFVFFYYST